MTYLLIRVLDRGLYVHTNYIALPIGLPVEIAYWIAIKARFKASLFRSMSSPKTWCLPFKQPPWMQRPRRTTQSSCTTQHRKAQRRDQ